MSKHFVLTAARPVLQENAPATLQLEFADGLCLPLDLSDIIKNFRSLARLENPTVFATATLADGGRVVVWDNDDNLELAADNLRARAIEQAGGFSHEFIWNWMAKNNLTLDTAARAIGISRRMLAYYRSGKSQVPRTVALACIGWEAGEKQAA
jgi:predicted DNA-binding transcriptional regulator AlpA